MLEEGTEAPAFELPNQDGEQVALSDFEGQHVVVYFYPEADTPGCTTEACSFRDRWSDYADRDVAVLGVSDNSVEEVAEFSEKYDLPFDLLSDEDAAVAREYDSYGEKTVGDDTFESVLRNTYVVGPDGTIVAAFEGVDPEEHADEVLAAVE